MDSKNNFLDDIIEITYSRDYRYISFSEYYKNSAIKRIRLFFENEKDLLKLFVDDFSQIRAYNLEDPPKFSFDTNMIIFFQYLLQHNIPEYIQNLLLEDIFEIFQKILINERKNNIRIYARNYNIMHIAGGMGGLSYCS